MARTYEISFRLGAQMAGDFARTMTSASGALGQLNSRIGDINKQQGSIQSLTRLRNEVGNSARTYHQAQQRVEQLARQMAATANPSRELTREFERAKREASQAKTQLDNKRESLRNLDRELGTTGQSTRELSRRQEELARSAEQAREAQARMQRTMGDISANKAQRAELRGQMLDAVALAAALGTPIKMAMGFEQSMAEVGAVSRASTEDLAAMTKTARDLGATTNWSASQAASGMKYLSMAGFDATQTVAAMPGMLDLASAGAIDLGAAADIASNILSGFRMEAADMARVGDVLTNTFTSSNTDLNMLGQTMAYVAPVAEGLGQSIEITAAMAGKLGDAGIQGSKAGTALRSVMNRLAAPTGAAATALQNLGIETQDAEGNMRSMPDILADMDHAMQGMGNAARQEITSAVFGLEAASAASVLLGQAGSGELQKYAASLSETGSAARVANEQNATAAGAMRRLASAGESIAITMGNVLLPTLARGAEIFASVVGVVDRLAQQFPLLTAVIVGGTAAMIGLRIATIAGGYAWTFVRGAWLAAKLQLDKLRVSMLLAKLNQGKLTAATTMGTTVTKLMTAAQLGFSAALMATPIGWIIAGVAGLIAIGIALYKNWGVVSAFLSGVWQGIVEGLGPVNEQLRAMLVPLQPIGQAIGYVWQQVQRLFGWFAQLFKPVQHSEQSLQNATNAGATFGRIVAAGINIILTPIRVMLSLISQGINLFNFMRNAGSVAIQGIATAFESFNPLEWFRSGMERITGYLSNFSLFNSGASILRTMASGIRSAIGAPVEAVRGALSRVREFLPFSDAKVGPLSELTASGAAIMKTLGEGMGKVNTNEMMKPFKDSAANMLGSDGIKMAANMQADMDAQSPNTSGFTSSLASIMKTLGEGVGGLSIKDMMQSMGQSEGSMLGRNSPNTSGFTSPLASIMKTLGEGLGGLSIKDMMQSMGQSEGGMLGRNSLQDSANALQGGGMNGGINITLTQEININGGTGDVREQARAGAEEGGRSLMEQIESLMQRERRLAYD
jgi:TP901 family phage tail tape measure protein